MKKFLYHMHTNIDSNSNDMAPICCSLLFWTSSMFLLLFLTHTDTNINSNSLLSLKLVVRTKWKYIVPYRIANIFLWILLTQWTMDMSLYQLNTNIEKIDCQFNLCFSEIQTDGIVLFSSLTGPSISSFAGSDTPGQK